MFSMQDIGKRIFTVRKEHNMTQAVMVKLFCNSCG